MPLFSFMLKLHKDILSELGFEDVNGMWEKQCVGYVLRVVSFRSSFDVFVNDTSMFTGMWEIDSMRLFGFLFAVCGV